MPSQIYLKSSMGHASLMDVDDLTPLTLGRLKHRIQETTGIPIEQQILTCGSTMIHGTSSYNNSNEDSHHDHGEKEEEEEEDALLLVPEHDMLTMTVSQRVRGGKQVPVKMMTNHLPCGSQVTIDIDENATKDEIKLKLQEATGVPFEHIKVMLSGINQIVMGDKRTNVGYSTCGYANSVQLAVEKADS
mmetsp:Transcript_10770/g.21395  ORF Transcript_10770/g.21395 Transcript_10770/m.21395 type:complete len:189 (-) Transcript_10770:302-868(-)